VIFSVIEKFFVVGSQFIMLVLLVRLLPHDDYGIIGIVAGYFAFIHILNFSMESIILRDHKKYDHHIEKYIYNFMLFNIVKAILLIILTSMVAYYLTTVFQNNYFVYSIFSIALTYIGESLVAPLMTYNISKFNQKLVTKISFIKAVLNVTLLLGLFYIPTLEYVFYKDLIVNILYISIWIYFTSKIFKLSNIDFKKDVDFDFIKKSFLGYTLWTHLNGVVMNFIYKSDTFFLSLFIGISIIADYSIALNSAGVASILPTLLGQQNSVAISNAKDKEEEFRVTNTFIRLSAYIGIFTFFIFYFFGEFYLYLMTGKEISQDMFSYLIYIVGGIIIVKSFSAPLSSYINIKGSVFELFKNVLIPALVFTFIVYFFTAKYYGAIGVAQANILVSFFWLLLLVKEVKKYNYDFSNLFDFKYDLLFLKRILK